MRWLGTALLALSLTVSTISMAQVRAGQTAAGSARAAANNMAFRGGGSFFGASTAFPTHSWSQVPFRHNHFNNFNRFGVWNGNWAWGWGGGFAPASYGYYGGYPYDGGYPYVIDPSALDPAYTGYVGGTFSPVNSGQYQGYPYPQVPPGYAPPPDYYSAGPGPNYPNYPPAPGVAPQSQIAPSASTPSSGGMTTVNGSEGNPQPTVLVFRDGHKQEVSNYAIMGSTLFVLSGQRTRIPVAELDVPATVEINQNRGVNFRVPDKQ